MERKNISHLAIDLIEEALEKPNKEIILEGRIKKPICEPGVKEPSKKELEAVREDVLALVFYMSEYSTYRNHVDTDYISDMDRYQRDEICYQNGSKIILMRGRIK